MAEKLNPRQTFTTGSSSQHKREQILADHVVQLVEAVNLNPEEAKELLRRVSLVIDRNERTGKQPSP